MFISSSVSSPWAKGFAEAAWASPPPSSCLSYAASSPSVTLIPIFFKPETSINPSFVISSFAINFKNIPVLPVPPLTFIVPLFFT